jgi:hypothetical protein
LSLCIEGMYNAAPSALPGHYPAAAGMPICHAHTTSTLPYN